MMRFAPKVRPAKLLGLGMWSLLALGLTSSPGLASAPELGEDSGGAGTRFLACREDAWNDYYSCSARETGWGQAGCELAIELDLLGCDAQLVRDLNPWG